MKSQCLLKCTLNLTKGDYVHVSSSVDGRGSHSIAVLAGDEGAGAVGARDEEAGDERETIDPMVSFNWILSDTTSELSSASSITASDENTKLKQNCLKKQDNFRGIKIVNKLVISER